MQNNVKIKYVTSWITQVDKAIRLYFLIALLSFTSRFHQQVQLVFYFIYVVNLY
jgi:hypothetical protein